MAFSQSKKYRVFQGEVEAPYEYARTLPNGEKIGVVYMEFMPNFVDELSMNNEEILKYIELNHAEE